MYIRFFQRYMTAERWIHAFLAQHRMKAMNSWGWMVEDVPRTPLQKIFGCARIQEGDVQQLLALSGKGGAFFDVSRSFAMGPMYTEWHDQTEAESPVDYLRRMLTLLSDFGLVAGNHQLGKRLKREPLLSRASPSRRPPRIVDLVRNGRRRRSWLRALSFWTRARSTPLPRSTPEWPTTLARMLASMSRRGTVSSNREACDDFKRYVSEIEKDGVWGGLLELKAAAWVYDVRLIIFATPSPSTFTAQKKLVLAFRFNGRHYDLLSGVGGKLPRDIFEIKGRPEEVPTEASRWRQAECTGR